jgi:hypothetical protein
LKHWRAPIALAIIIMSTMTGCGGGGATGATGSSAGCADQLASWDDHGGLSRFDAIASDARREAEANGLLMTALSSGVGLAAAESAVQSAAAAIRSNTAAAEAYLPPVCIPHLRADEEAALRDYGKTAADYDNAISEIRSKNYGMAAKAFSAATTTQKEVTAKITAASKDIATFRKSQLQARDACQRPLGNLVKFPKSGVDQVMRISIIWGLHLTGVTTRSWRSGLPRHSISRSWLVCSAQVETPIYYYGSVTI